MKTLDATSRAGGAVAVLVMSAVLSGCYSYVPYGYVPYDELPAVTAQQQYPFTIPDAAASGAAVLDATASTSLYTGPVAPVFVAPAYYPVAYPYYGWQYYGWPAWRGPSVSLGFGYWGGCCYGWRGRGYGGHHGYWGHGYRGGRGGRGGWGGRGYPGRGMGGGGHYRGGDGGHGRPH
jgi:hypothetical protein